MIHTAGPDTNRRFRAFAAALVGLATAAMLIRASAIAQPLGIDQGLWASAAHGMDHGQLLYRDVWEQRPPGIYWVYLFAFRTLGWETSTIAWLDLAAAATTTWLLYGVARSLTDRITAAVAAAIYATMTMPAWLYGNGGFLERAVSETFIVVAVCAAVWCAVRWTARPFPLSAAGLGLFAGATLIFKPNAGLYLPALLLWAWLYTPEARADRAGSGLSLVAAVAASAALPVIALVWLWQLGLLDEARTAVVDFNRYYVGEGFDLRAYALAFSRLVWLRMKTEPLWTAGAAGALASSWLLARERRLPPVAGLAVIWGAAAACVIVVNGARLFNSYFIQALPPLALLASWFLVTALKRSRGWRVAGFLTLGIMALLLIQRDYLGRVVGQARADAAVLRGDIPSPIYLERFGGYNNGRGYSARANTDLAGYLRTHTAPGDRIFLFGINGAGVYFEADRLAAHRFLRVNFFVDTEFPHAAFRLESVIRDLEAAPPLYLIFERLHRSSVPSMQQAVDALPRHPLVRGLLSDYELETAIEDFSLYRRVE